LLHDERPVAWLTGNRFAFTGFGNAMEAAYAAWVAYRTVSRKLAPALGVRPTPIDIEPLCIEWRDGREMILASGRPIAALVRPDAHDATATQWLGFSIELPPAIDGRRMREVVLTAHRALLKSGIPWSMMRPRRRLGCCLPRLEPTRYVPSPNGDRRFRRRVRPVRHWRSSNLASGR
jgi:hypothetical protein